MNSASRDLKGGTSVSTTCLSHDVFQVIGACKRTSMRFAPESCYGTFFGYSCFALNIRAISYLLLVGT